MRPPLSPARYPLLCLVALGALAFPARADSPLTSVSLHSGYDGVPAVQEAIRSRLAEGAVLTALLGEAPLDQKAAVVSALGWSTGGQDNARRFLEGLAKARGVDRKDITLDHLTVHDRFVLGFLLAMDDYFEMGAIKPGASDLWGASALELLSQAALALPESFTAQLVRALVQAQSEMARSMCSVFVSVEAVLRRFSDERRDLRRPAVESVTGYIGGYEAYCGVEAPTPPPPDPGEAPPAGRRALPTDPQLDMIYAITTYRGRIVTGTQGGVVLWDRETGLPVNVRKEFICANLLVWKDHLWAGCEYRLIRFDGESWKTYLHEADSAEVYRPLPGPQGELLVAFQGQLHRLDEERDRFEAAPRYLGGGGGYDIVYRKDGAWRIHFLDSVEGGRRRFPLRSRAYPGGDPRSFYEDPTGALWVADFGGGFFRYDERTGLFVHDPAVADKGSAMVVDPARDRTWFLHYTDGLYLREGFGAPRFFDLHDLEYMRALHLDARGELWVGGWNRLVRFREVDGEWQQEAWRIGPAEER